MLYIEKTSSTDKKYTIGKKDPWKCELFIGKPSVMHVNMLAKVEIAIARPDLHL